MKPKTVDGSVVAAMLALRPDRTPAHLREINPVKKKTDFDANAYFDVLTGIAMKDGYTLDYVYHFVSGFGGYPCLYARPVDAKPLYTFAEYRDWEEENMLLYFMVADGTPDSFFQLVVFNRLAVQFYLQWHANYHDIRIVTAEADMEAITTEINGENSSGRTLAEEQVAGMRKAVFAPSVEITEDLAAVNYCVFSKWGGLTCLKESFLKSSPHRPAGMDILAEVKYSCGFVY